MGDTGDEAKQEARRFGRLRMWLALLLLILTSASAANIWYALSTRNEVPPAATTQAEPAAASAESWDPRYDALEPHQALSTWASHLTAFGMGLAVPVLWILALAFSYVRWKVAAMDASSLKGRTRKWSDKLGKQTLHGEVIAIDTDAKEAFVVEIEQRYDGDDSRAGQWREISRRHVIHPFTIALPRGQHVRVEPDERTELAVGLDETTQLEKYVRRRRFCVGMGQTVCVVGRVERWVDESAGYGGVAEGRVMRPPRRGRMQIATGALERSFARRARFARGWLIAWSVCFLLPCWSAYFPFWVSTLYGEPGVATVVAKATKTVKRRKQADYETHVLRLRIDATGQQFTDWVRPSLRSPDVGARVPVFYAPQWIAHAQVGKTPTLPRKEGEDDRAFFGVPFTILLMIAYGLGLYLRTHPWWERKRVDEHLVDKIEPEPSDADPGTR